MSNRLAKEESPYLLQHKNNPVDWYPWGEEAFNRAKELDLPIFLSIGYSTCHWCHVMERESFESEEVAELMNRGFVNIKVDREERPDVDKVYMTYVQAISGSGGWPMSVFLTPSLEPIVGGTYFPPNDAYGRPGFKTVLKKVSTAWQKDKQALMAQGNHIMSSIEQAVNSQESGEGGVFDAPAAEAAIAKAYEQLAEKFDDQNGGFTSAPKFPRVSEINLVLVRHLMLDANKSAEAGHALHMAELTLQKMGAGGIHDHLGGGFARYSVDEKWHVPHFEKMLYDNPQIVQTYLAAFQATKNPQYASIARDTLDYLLRDMRHPEGGFYSAEDADSLEREMQQKKEGAFYVWERKEAEEVLGGTDSSQARLFMDTYHVLFGGNATLSQRSDPHGEFEGKNILIRLKDANLSSEDEAELAAARKKLHERRAQLPRPHLDDKVVCGWNGMAIGALAAASLVLPNQDPPALPLFPVDGRDPAEYLDAAIKAAEFVEKNLWDEGKGQLRRSFCRGPSQVDGFDGDYALLIGGLLDLHAAGGGSKWLAWAYKLQEAMDTLFWDDKAGGYFSTTGKDASIRLRMKEDQDGAEPAASSVAVGNLLRLAAMVPQGSAEKLRQRALDTLAAHRDRLTDMPVALTQMCCSAFLLTAGHMQQVIISGPAKAKEVKSLLAAAHATFCPDKVVIHVDPADEADVTFWEARNPDILAMAKSAKDGKATAFVCQNFTCRAPTSDPEKVKTLLSERAQAGGGKTTEYGLPGLEL